jgi:cell wall-associated NlpC family hydrolase
MVAASLAAWCRSAGTSMTLDQAHATAGALVFLGGQGVEHHVAISTGDGRVFAARGVHETPHIGFTTFYVDGWASAGWPPGLARVPLSNPLPGPTSPGEAAAMGFICGAVVPGSHPQEHPKEWEAHAPFVAVEQDPKTRHWSMVGMNGAALLNHGYQGKPPTNAFGVSVVDLGPLNGAIFDKDVPTSGPFAGKIVFLADDGGTFIPVVQVHYPTTG